MADFSHLAESGKAKMVDVGAKAASQRHAVVSGTVRVSKECQEELVPPVIGEISSVAKIAGIQAAKQTAQLIPLCHNIPLSAIDIDIEFKHEEGAFFFSVRTKTNANTGVEMEAMTAAAITGLTIYDMIKAKDPLAQIGPIRLIEKEGGETPIKNSQSVSGAKSTKY